MGRKVTGWRLHFNNPRPISEGLGEYFLLLASGCGTILLTEIYSAAAVSRLENVVWRMKCRCAETREI